MVVHYQKGKGEMPLDIPGNTAARDEAWKKYTSALERLEAAKRSMVNSKSTLNSAECEFANAQNEADKQWQLLLPLIDPKELGKTR